MPARPDMEDSLSRDRRFRRAGWRRAWLAALAIVAALAILGRIAPPAEPATVRRTPHWTWVLPGAPAEAALADVRAVRSPAAFSLPSPAGFTGALRGRSPRLAPPVRRADRPAAPASASSAPPLPDWTSPALAPRAPLPPGDNGWKPVFANRRPPAETPRIDFPAGWEPRIFSGLDLTYPAWSPATAWTATADLAFNESGIPVSVLLDRPSGDPAIDRRLARSAASWRLLDPAAPRRGKVTWRVPAATATAEPAAVADAQPVSAPEPPPSVP